MERIAITGGIGSGKSTASTFLADHYGLPLIDVDLICKNLLLPGEKGWLALKLHFGSTFFKSDGRLDRACLRKALFADETLRQKIDHLLHPLARKEVASQIAKLRSPFILVEVPLLFEAGWQDDFERIIVVFADNATCCRRIANRDQVSDQEAWQALRAQKPLREKVLMADYVIDNSFCRVFTQLQLVYLAEGLFQEIADE